MFHHFPYTNLHELNLDWLIEKVKEAYSPDNPPENIVLSVNGQTGDVVLYEAALVELPPIPENDMWQIRRNTQGNINRGIAFAGNGRAYIIEGSENHQIYDSENPPPYPVTSVNSATGAVILYQNPSVIFPEVEDTTWRIFRNAGGATLGIRFTNGKIYRINSTDNFEMYDAGNPPPYPVTSVNGQTGAVQITFPVTSVNGQTGAVNIQVPFVSTAPEMLEFRADSPGDYWGMLRNTTNGQVGIYFDSENDTVKAYISYMPEDESTAQPQTFQLLTTNDIPSSAGVVSVNGLSGVVVIRATDITRTANNAETVETALARIDQKDGTQDNAISGLQSDVSTIHQSMAIIADSNTHAAIQAGQAVFVKNHATLATGLYWANEAIGTDVALTSSNLTADSNGGFNHLQGEIATLNSNLKVPEILQMVNDQYNYLKVVRIAAKNTALYIVRYIRKTEVANTTEVYSIDPNYAPTAQVADFAFYQQASGFSLVQGVLKADGTIQLMASQYNENLAGEFTFMYVK